MSICVHCLIRPGGYSRGLCLRCYMMPEIRAITPLKTGRPGPGCKAAKRPARRPTKARPGSNKKVNVLARRLDRREELWHPDDYVPGCD